ncbi:MAG TPA: molecular chaperone TorD family protein [Symbiobacteriaceae bacterium]|jgi:TorA maturation chaperone TorD
MDERTVRAQLYSLLAARLYQPDDAAWQAICSGKWAGAVRTSLAALELSLAVPLSLGACPEDAARRDYWRAFLDPARRVRPVESLFKVWTQDPTAELPLAGEKGWLGGDPAAHLLSLYTALGIAIPPELGYAPDHLALELEFMGLLVRHGTPEQQEQFRRQHLDWLPDLVEDARRREAPPSYIDLLTLVSAAVAARL